MTSPLANCPECEAYLPAPCFRRGKGRVRVRCRVCRKMVSMRRQREIRIEDDDEDPLGRSVALEGYEMLGLLGQGGMGVVYSAVRQHDHELVAIKVLPPDCLRYPELVMRFEQEARLMATISHPSIVPINDQGRWENLPYIVMDYVPGQTLRERIEQRAPLPLPEALTIAASISEAIQRCHDGGLVHRDLKPGNILLSQGGKVMVTDFGIANLLHVLGEQTDFGVAIGTPQYIAPEQRADGSKVDVRADQFSLAVIIYEMLTRKLPTGAFPPVSRSCRGITPAAEQVIMRALSTRAEDRFESIRQFIRALRRALPHELDGPGPKSRVRMAVKETTPPPGSFVFVDPVAFDPRVVDESEALEDDSDRYSSAETPKFEPPSGLGESRKPTPQPSQEERSTLAPPDPSSESTAMLPGATAPGRMPLSLVTGGLVVGGVAIVAAVLLWLLFGGG